MLALLRQSSRTCQHRVFRSAAEQDGGNATTMRYLVEVRDSLPVFSFSPPTVAKSQRSDKGRLHQLRRCIQILKQLLYRATCIDDVMKDDSHTLSHYFGLSLIYNSSKAMIDLYDRSSRRPLCLPKLWLVEDLLEKEIRRCKTAHEYTKLLSHPVLRVCPFLVSFKRRLKLFDRIVSKACEVTYFDSFY